ncbi:MAG: phage capsid protein [Bacilli bacterium]
MNQKTEIQNKWKPLVEAEGLPEIVSASNKDIVAAILENQDRDIRENAVYRDEFISEQLTALGEAVVTGDHGYAPTDIAAGKNSGAAVGVGPTVMGMVRRAIPNMIAFDICGVQPMAAPTGQIFSLRAMYGANPTDANAMEAFHPIAGPNVSWSGDTGSVKAGGITGRNLYVAVGADGTNAGTTGTAGKVAVGKTKFYRFVNGQIVYLMNAGTAEVDLSATIADENSTDATDTAIRTAISSGTLVEISQGMATSYAELMQDFNGSTGNPWNEMSFRIDKQTVEAKSRQLKAQYSIELAQDLMAVHGISADSELSKVLATEIMLEINREIVLWINATAQVGKRGWTNLHGGQQGVFNFADPNDVRGARWSGESYKALIIQIDKEANEIARQTGRGAGNFIIASRNLVAALGHTDMMVGPAAMGTITGMNTNTNNSVFAGVLAGKYRVYIDQYAKEDYFTVGYKGTSQMDAGIYYSPYVALTPLRGSDPKNFQPVMGFKTRYAIGVNPLANASKTKGFTQINNGMPVPEMMGNNCYFRRVYVKGL